MGAVFHLLRCHIDENPPQTSGGDVGSSCELGPLETTGLGTSLLVVHIRCHKSIYSLVLRPGHGLGGAVENGGEQKEQRSIVDRMV